MTSVSEIEVERFSHFSGSSNSTALVDIPFSTDSSATSALQGNGFVDLREYLENVSVASMLGRINYVFSLNYKRLSEIMLVTRPTIYSWLDGGAVSDWSKIERLRILYTISNYWWSKVREKMEPDMRKLATGERGKSVDELLGEESLEIWRLVSTLNAVGDLALFVQHKKPLLASRLKKKGLKRKSAAAVDRDIR